MLFGKKHNEGATGSDELKKKDIAIEESPVNIYCKVKKIEKLGSHDMFIAEVVGVTVDEEYMDEKNRFDLGAANLITYSHGEYFCLGKKMGKFGYSVKKPVKKKKR